MGLHLSYGRYAAIAAVLALAIGPAQAQQPPPSQCGPLKDVLTTLANKFEEHVIWSGEDSGHDLLLTQSVQKRTWSLIALHLTVDGVIGCIEDVGGNGHVAGVPDNSTIGFIVRGSAVGVGSE